MTNGSAVIHINGAQYQLADQYTDPSSAGFQNLTQRIEKMPRKQQRSDRALRRED